MLSHSLGMEYDNNEGALGESDTDVENFKAKEQVDDKGKPTRARHGSFMITRRKRPYFPKNMMKVSMDKWKELVRELLLIRSGRMKRMAVMLSSLQGIKRSSLQHPITIKKYTKDLPKLGDFLRQSKLLTMLGNCDGNALSLFLACAHLLLISPSRHQMHVAKRKNPLKLGKHHRQQEIEEVPQMEREIRAVPIKRQEGVSIEETTTEEPGPVFFRSF